MSNPPGATGFQVLSMGQDHPAPASGRYEWNENVCDPAATTQQVGDDHFEGDVEGDKFTCTGWITLNGGSGWHGGTVNLSGTLYLVNGLIDHGDLAVVSSTKPVTFRGVRVDRVNPKRYTTV
jgi:hypothetical protein